MGDERGESRAGTRLLVRANQADLGLRPVSPSWQSPDIYQEGGTSITEVVESTPIQLAALVTNVGTEPALGVRVDFWWADSGLGLSKASANPIGQSEIKGVAVGASVEFLCDTAWVPQSVSSGAHPCLVVEAAGLNCPVHDTFRPDLDSQVGQRNVMVKPPSGLRRMIFRAFNPLAEGAPTLVYATTYRLDGERARDLPQAMILEAGFPPMQAMLREQGVIVEELGSSEFLRITDIGEVEHARDAEMRTSSERAGFRAERPYAEPLCEMDLPGGGSAAFTVEPVEGGPADALLVHRIVQVTGGFEVGGYTIIDG